MTESWPHQTPKQTVKTNLEWEEAVCDFLGSLPSRFLNGESLAHEERAILTMAMAAVGSPPETAEVNDPIEELAFELPQRIRPPWDGTSIRGNSGTH